MKTVIVWFRNDLRVHDHPALFTACEDADHVVPVFILNKQILSGEHAGSNRNRFLIESLADLKDSLKKRGSDLLIKNGDAATELKALAKELKAEAVYYSADFTTHAIKRDVHVKLHLEKAGIEFRSFPGRLIVSSLDKLHTKTGKPHKVFTPFWKNWQQVGRRELAAVPKKISFPSNLSAGSLPKIGDYTKKNELSPNVLKGGEKAARVRLDNYLKNDIHNYADTNNNVGTDTTSRLSAYLHFGCLSPLEIESKLPPSSKSVAAWHRQLAWREFYHYVIYSFPDNATKEFQERYRNLKWGTDTKLFKAWCDGQTGYPLIDAGMRQLNNEGWMHNRARLAVGSFLTKDLWLDWRLGETYFMKMLIDGDEANNNGNWQWIASVGVDPAPVFRRMYNPSSQMKNYDPEAIYVRRYVKELKNVPDKYIVEPWTMPAEIQKQSKCIIGSTYPKPIVDHAEARKAALDQYKNA